MELAGVLFLTTYILMFKLDKYKQWIALSSGLSLYGYYLEFKYHNVVILD